MAEFQATKFQGTHSARYGTMRSLYSSTAEAEPPALLRSASGQFLAGVTSVFKSKEQEAAHTLWNSP